MEGRQIIAQMAASEIDIFLEHVFSELSDAHNFADFDPADPDLTSERRAMAHIQREIGQSAASILFLDAVGKVVITSPPDLYEPGADLSQLPHIAQALEKGGAVVSEPFLNEATGRSVAAMSVPFDDNGRTRGLLVALVDLSGQAITIPLERAARLGNTGHATLIDGEGRTLAATLDVPFLSGSEHPVFYREAMARGLPTVGTTPFALSEIYGETYQELHVMAFAPLSAAPWGMAVGGDLDDTFAGVRRLRFGLILMGVVTLIGVWVVTLGGTRRLMRPIQQLTAAAQKIARGELHTPLHAPAYGEIGVMAAALAQMQTQIVANINKLSAWNESLEERVAEQTQAIRQQQALTQRLLRHTIIAQEEERKRISRELHDGIGQMLMAIEFSLARISRRLPYDDAQAQKYLEESRNLTESTVADLRRVIGNLRPSALDQLGLESALKWIGKHVLRPAGITMTMEANGMPDQLPDEIRTILFRIAQEAISNVARHSQATHLNIDIFYEKDQISMSLRDDGKGFDPTAVSPDTDKHRGFGLAGMQERASLAGGQVTITSTPGMGTEVNVTIPIHLTDHVNKEGPA
ncbi:MAG: histidine kinase [Anaerolineae bacterium]